MWHKEFQFWNEKCLICVILGCEFRAKIKIVKFKTKTVLLGIFRLKIGKNDCDIWNQPPRICRNAKKFAKQGKKIKFGTKTASFGYFGLKFEKIFLHLNSASSNLWKCKVSSKLKILNFGTKSVWFRCF